jgi:hypothetical protein
MLGVVGSAGLGFERSVSAVTTPQVQQHAKDLHVRGSAVVAIMLSRPPDQAHPEGALCARKPGATLTAYQMLFAIGFFTHNTLSID